jgi:3'(2'), 5'-bisphosphate nucleotidase
VNYEACTAPPPASPKGADDHGLAHLLAAGAGQVLLALRRELAGAEAQQRKDAGDQASQGYLAAALGTHRPNDAILSEEATDDGCRRSARRVWIIDPLDGTREYSEPDRSDWAVHVALWEDGDLVAGAVGLPALGVTLSTPDVAVGERRTGAAPRIVVSRTRPPAVATRLREHLGGQLVALGSAGAKAMAVVQGRADIYVHAGGQYEWDSAAPVAVARAAGLHTSRIDGSPLRYNAPDPLMPDLLICRPEYVAATLSALGELEVVR